MSDLVSAPRREREDARPGGEVYHYAHPSDLARMWCGAPRNPDKPWVWHGRESECVVCADLWLTFGTDGWWRGEPL